MTHSEFWALVESVYGSAYGQALTRDLALPQMGHRPAAELLDDGADPQRVWLALLHETGMTERFAYLHRVDPEERHRRM
ncbi:MAG: DUF3046 domain-containing protein [Flaviflexus sp.]|nr:DUF3046 domain-containing protein [Flaviflexus sp.]